MQGRVFAAASVFCFVFVFVEEVPALSICVRVSVRDCARVQAVAVELGRSMCVAMILLLKFSY